MSKARLVYWMSFAVLAFAPLAMFKVSPCGFFDGPRGD